MVDFSPRNLWQISRFDVHQYVRLLPRLVLRSVGCLLLAAVLSAHLNWAEDWARVVSMVAVSGVAFALLRYHLRQMPAVKVTARNAERVIWYATVLGAVGVQIVHASVQADGHGPGFLTMAPLVAAAMLVSALLDPARAIIALTITSLLLGIGGGAGFEMLAASWLAGGVGAHAVNPLTKRSDLLRAITVQLGAQAAVGAAMAASEGLPGMALLTAAGWAAVSAVLATSFFWFGVVVLERVFHIVSDWTLLELCSPDQPLIRELCMKAPGTYAHSVMVANLAESAAVRIGANPVLVRAMAYYHDIGKLLRPSYFIENQVGPNVHDDLSPTLSAQVIASHVTDGVQLAHKHRLPAPIVEAIAQHHGTSLIRFFYHRALEQGAGSVGIRELESLFRYEGPRPRSKEVAILHLADMVEAVSRVLPKGQSIESTVREIVARSMDDGQLRESDLTFRDLDQITESFVHSLGALRHERIAYPEALPASSTPNTDLDSERLVPTSSA